MEPDEKIIQILAATDWFLVFKDPDGKEFKCPIEVWGLSDLGHLYASDAGEWVSANDNHVSNFDRFEHKSEMK